MDIRIKEEYVKKAMELHQKYPVVDAHLDLAGEILLRTEAGEKNIIRTYYLENWKKAGINLIMSSVYVPNHILRAKGTVGAWENAMQQIEVLKRDCKSLKNVMIVTSVKELQQVLDENKIGILIYMEGLCCIGTDLEKLEQLHALGVRGAALTWSRENALAMGCCKASEHRQMPGGLSELGRAAVRKIEELSWFLDVSHLNDDGFEDVAMFAGRPFLATHSCARAVYDNYRNLTDEQMRALTEKGGVMGLNGCRLITGSQSGNHLEMLCLHAEYEVRKIGAKHVGFGFDLCDSYDRAEYALRKKSDESAKPPKEADCLLDHGQIPLVTAALIARGMREEDVIGIIGKNFINFLKKTLPEE